MTVNNSQGGCSERKTTSVNASKLRLISNKICTYEELHSGHMTTSGPRPFIPRPNAVFSETESLLVNSDAVSFESEDVLL